MSPNVDYCKNCKYKFDQDESSQCPSCGHEGVVGRAQYIKTGDNRVPKEPSILNITEIANPDSKRTERQVKNQSSGTAVQLNQAWDPSIQTSADARAIVEAQAKTTYAVRSLALYLFITLESGLVGGAFIFMVINNKSSYDSYGQLNSLSTFVLSLGVLIAVGGFIVAVVVGRNELNKSRL